MVRLNERVDQRMSFEVSEDADAREEGMAGNRGESKEVSVLFDLYLYTQFSRSSPQPQMLKLSFFERHETHSMLVYLEHPASSRSTLVQSRMMVLEMGSPRARNWDLS